MNARPARITRGAFFVRVLLLLHVKALAAH